MRCAESPASSHGSINSAKAVQRLSRPGLEPWVERVAGFAASAVSAGTGGAGPEAGALAEPWVEMAGFAAAAAASRYLATVARSSVSSRAILRWDQPAAARDWIEG